METTITITTINEPRSFLNGLCENIRKFNHDKVDIIIIGDKKTPDITSLCEQLSRNYKVPIDYLDVIKQNEIIPRQLLDMFDYNTPDRTILGGMLAYLRGAQRVIAVDDDNYVTNNDFVGWHNKVGVAQRTQLIVSNTGWFNVHEVLKADVNFYPRGYPFRERHKMVKTDVLVDTRKVAVNQGLVLGDPDIDAIQRLAHPIRATAMKSKYGQQFGFSKTWSPFNYQNTCLCRDLIPCYFRPKSGLRNADIWTAYIFNKLVEQMGDVITFGQPLVNQDRNEHDLFDDLAVEFQNNRETEYFCKVVRETKLSSITYFQLLNELVYKVNIDEEHPMTKSFFREYKAWIQAVNKFV